MFDVIDFRMVKRTLLDPHPDAEAFLRTEQDQLVMSKDILRNGMNSPLHVIEKPGGRYWVIDGVTRLASVPDAVDCPCLYGTCDDVETFVLSQNCARRRVTTGTRILSYLLQHKDVVLAADDRFGDGRFNDVRNPNKTTVPHVGHRGGYTDEDLRKWTVIAIAEDLKVHRDDVAKALELLRCSERGRVPEVKKGTAKHAEREADRDDAADREMLDCVRICKLRVLGGDLPIRKWTAAFNGRAVTEGGKAETDYSALGVNSMRSLLNVFENWDKVGELDRGDLIRKFQRVLDKYNEKVMV